MDGKPETNADSVTVATCSTPVREATPRTDKALEDKSEQADVLPPSKEGSAPAGAVGDEHALPQSDKSARARRRSPHKGGNSTTTTTPSTAWKPNAQRPLDWFPVPGRQVFLVDPNDVKAAATAAGAKATAVREAANNSSEGDDSRPAEKGAGGEACANHCEEGERAWTEKVVSGGGQDPEKRPGSTRPRKAEGGGGLAGDTRESRDRSEVLLSARSGFPSASVLANLLLSPANGRPKEARARVPSGKIRACCDGSSPARADKARSCHDSDLTPNYDPPRTPSLALDLMSQSVREGPDTKPEVDAQHRAKHISANAVHCHARIPVASGLGANFNTSTVTSEDEPWAARLPDGRPGAGAGAGEGGKVVVGHINAHRRRASVVGATNILGNRDGGLQINQLRPGSKAPRVAGAPRLLHENRRPPSGLPQPHGVKPFDRRADENVCGAVCRKRSPVFRSSNSGEVGSNGKMPGVAGSRSTTRFAPQGRETMNRAAREHGGGGISTWPASPWDSDTGLDECISISSTANSSINSCCGWMKTGSQN